ncbi:MAG: flagellar protein FliT [Selenomonadaceae bacterium]|nr:flagellar protein FliT [Selenomonadaceae bacterium]
MHDDEEVIAQARGLWRKYVVITREMLKFIDKRDVDTFLTLVPQRSQLIELMKALPQNNFRETDECKAMIEQIKPMDMQIAYKARAWLNKSRRQTSTVRSYDLTSAFGNRGRIFNQKY